MSPVNPWLPCSLFWGRTRRLPACSYWPRGCFGWRYLARRPSALVLLAQQGRWGTGAPRPRPALAGSATARLTRGLAASRAPRSSWCDMLRAPTTTPGVVVPSCRTTRTACDATTGQGLLLAGRVGRSTLRRLPRLPVAAWPAHPAQWVSVCVTCFLPTCRHAFCRYPDCLLGVSILLGLNPGPDNIFVLLQSAQRGWRGHGRGGGLCKGGLVVHTGAVALGLAAVFAASAVAFTVCLLLGAATWRTWRGILRAPLSSAGPDAGARALQPSRTQPVAHGGARHDEPEQPQGAGVLPAFLPQFADPAGAVPMGGQLMVLGLVFIVATFAGVWGHRLFFGRVRLCCCAARAAVAQPGGGVVFLGWLCVWPHRNADGLFAMKA